MEKLYEKSGVNLKEAERLNNSLKRDLKLSAFAGAVKLNNDLKIVTCCDGIGSKIIPLYERKMYQTIATDVVAANLNDLVCSGATAVGFVDYIAVNKLDSEAISKIIQGINIELTKCNCKLLGGETSEIGELITQNNIDISGFAVGVKTQNNFDKNNVKEGDIIVGLASSGIHANGFSLVRKLYSDGVLSEEEFISTLKPTNIYYNEVLKLIQEGKIKSCANITGGGILSNLLRSVPETLGVELDFNIIPTQEIFQKLMHVCGEEFYEVFNAGVGFCIVTSKEDLQCVLDGCKVFSPFVFGEITK